MRGGEGGVTQVTRNYSQIHAKNYSGAQFNVPNRVPMPGPSPDPGTARDWGVDLCRSCVCIKYRCSFKLNPTHYVDFYI